ncbi:MAG: TIGR01777 family oxidoreductase [Deltaproteobacteria bacterium]
MRICITGGTGFIGRALRRHLLAAGHSLTLISRRSHTSGQDSNITYLKADPTVAGSWEKKLVAHDAVINLAGASIFRPWTTANQRKIIDSRLLTTGNIADALICHPGKCKVLLSASAVGYYGFEDKGDILREDHAPGEDFLAELAKRWEDEATRAEAAGVRVARCRFAVVLGAGGGALAKMLPAFRLGLGSALGTGRQPFPWIHLDDLCRALLFLLEHEELDGPFNFAAPQAVTNYEFSMELSRVLKRPHWLPALPTFLLTLFHGEMATMILHGQKVVPARLLDSGFHFSYPELRPALKAILEAK